MALVSCALTYLLAKHLRDSALGLYSSAILASTGLFYVLAGGVMTDPALGLCTTLSMVSLALALRASSRRSQLGWGYAFFLGLGGSLLAKGLVGLVLIIGPSLAWAVLARRLTEMGRVLPWKSGILLTLGISLPWHLLMELRTPGFLEYYVVGEHFKRFFVRGWEGNLYGNTHKHVPGTIWGFFVVATFPWVFLLIPSLLWLLKRRRAYAPGRDENSWHVYLLLWCVAPAMLFTFAQNIMITYLLPSLPAFAILTALVLQEVGRLTAAGERPWFICPAAARCSLLIVPVAFTTVAMVVLPFIGNSRSQRELVSAFRAAQDEHAADLLYIGRLPYSAEFYSNGGGKTF